MGIEAIIGLGGNVGDVPETFTSARSILVAGDDIRLLASSNLYRSPPMGPQNQPDYLNAVIVVQTTLPALQLLRRMQAIELQHGRTRSGKRWGKRTLDLDLIAYDDAQTYSEALILPHPGMAERMFVLQPLCDVRKNWQHPADGKNALQLLHDLQCTGIALLAQGEVW